MKIHPCRHSLTCRTAIIRAVFATCRPTEPVFPLRIQFVPFHLISVICRLVVSSRRLESKLFRSDGEILVSINPSHEYEISALLEKSGAVSLSLNFHLARVNSNGKIFSASGDPRNGMRSCRPEVQVVTLAARLLSDPAVAAYSALNMMSSIRSYSFTKSGEVDAALCAQNFNFLVRMLCSALSSHAILCYFCCDAECRIEARHRCASARVRLVESRGRR